MSGGVTSGDITSGGVNSGRLRGRAALLRTALQVIASWLTAIALLCAALRLLNVTPGYRPDHLE